MENKTRLKVVKYIIMLLLINVCVINTGNNSMNSVRAAETSLQSLMNEYVGTYWTTNGKPADSNGSTSKNYYGIQCKGFANYMFYRLFNVTYIGAYDSNKYYLPNPSGATEVGKAWNFASNDTAKVSQILSKGQPGDFIQVRRRGKSWGHSMILVDKDSNGITVFDCNSDGKCGVRKYYITWASFASSNIGLSLYHAKDYPYNKKAPEIPQITSTKSSTSTITVNWNKVADADSYRIDRRQSGAESYETIKTLSSDTDSYKDSGLKAGVKYYYRVYAKNSAGTSAKPDGYGAWTIPDVTTINSVKTVGEKSLQIKWNKQTGAASYTLLRRKSGEENYTAIKTVTDTKYTDSDLKLNVKYWYKIVCNNDGGSSSRSEAVGGYTYLKAPSVKMEGNSVANLNWTQYTTNESIQYQVYRDNKKIATISGTEYTDKGLKGGTSYVYKIQVAEKQSGNALITSNETKVNTVPDVPVYTIDNITTNSVRVKWNSVTGAVSYEVYRRKPGEDYPAKPTYTTKNTYVVDSGLSAGQTYYYRVYSVDAFGQKSAKPSAINITTKYEQADCTHVFSDYTVTKNPACTAAGSKYRTCSKCDYKQVVSINATGHNFGEYKVTKAETCTNAGSKERVCKVCATKETASINALGHNYRLIKTVEPTVDSEGYKEYGCANCNGSYKEIIAAKGNDADKNNATTENQELSQKEEPSKSTEPIQNTTTISDDYEVTTEKTTEVNTSNTEATTETATEYKKNTPTTEVTTEHIKDMLTTEAATERIESTPTTEKATEDLKKTPVSEELSKDNDNTQGSETDKNGEVTSDYAKASTEEYDEFDLESEDETPLPEEEGTILVVKKKKCKVVVTSSDADKPTVEYFKSTNKNAKNITIPEKVVINDVTYTVTSISDKAFKNNKKLRSVVISKNIKTIGKEAFMGCKNLSKVTFKTKVLSSIGNKAFKNTSKKVKIKVPKGKAGTYKKMLKKAGYK